MNWYHERNWRPLSGAAVIGLLVFGLSLQVAPADDSGNLLSAENAASVDRSGGGAGTPVATREREPLSAPLRPEAAERQRYKDADTVEAVESRVHFAKVIGSSPVSSAGGAAASRGPGGLGIAEPCNCDEDCDPTLGGLGDQCNLVQCIVRGICSQDDTVTCSTAQAGGSADADCDAAGAGVCLRNSFKQRCDVVQLVGDWPCETGNGFCIEDRCEDDGSGSKHSHCVTQTTGVTKNSVLSPCPKECVGGAAQGLRCNRSSQCPQGDCMIKGGGLCDDGTEACYVGPSVANAIGRCCTAGSCTETTLAACGGVWLRYTDPEQVVSDDQCICPKYGSGVAPNGIDSGSIGPVRPSGLVCEAGSTRLPDPAPVYCEDMDGDGKAPQYCLRRCVLGDNIGALCEVDNPDCGRTGWCDDIAGGPVCLVENNGSDCGDCSITPQLCDETGFNDCPAGETCEFGGVHSCPARDPGECRDDPCASNTLEGGCEDGFIQIGDDYSLSNSSYLRLTQFRFRGGITFQGEDIIFEIWDETGTILVDTLQVEIQTGGVDAPTENLPLTGTRDWTIEIDCWPTCDPNFEVPQPNPVIIPPRGYVVMRSVRTVGTLNGATAFWSQTDSPADEGDNNDALMWIDGVPVDGTTVDPSFTNVLIFELVGVKVPAPFGACCDQGGAACHNSLRWECGQCTPDGSPSCSSTLLDCPDGGLKGSVCQFNKWFGPISHADFEFGALDLRLCDENDPFLAPCDEGGCCQAGIIDGFCTVEKEPACNAIEGAIWLGPATDCDPDCCPKDPIGVDCICETWNCQEEDGFIPGFVCDPANGDDDCDDGQTCVFSCAPDPAHITQLRHPYECHDSFGSPQEPPIPCDPADGTGLDVFNQTCDDAGLADCLQSFTTSVTVTKTDFIEVFFGVVDGDACSLNTTSDKVGWFERFTLVDPTPNDGADDCFVLTVSMCCTDPVLTPIWAFLSQFLECPCFEFSDVFGIPPDFDLANNLKSGFGPASLSNFPCEDENYAGTFTVGPGDYAYQIRAGRICQGVIPTEACVNDEDCPGACVVGTPDYTVHFTVESCNVGACCVNEVCSETNKLDCLAQEGNFLGDGDQPILTCQAAACSLGSCCLEGTCNDDEFHDTPAACVGQGGEYFGGVGCDASPCPACPFHLLANCQQVQTIFGLVPQMDRNPANGSDEMTSAVLADDLKFGGGTVDTICWNTGFFQIPCCATGCDQNIDGTWEVRIYGENAECDAIPGVEIGRSTLDVLNKVEGTGQGTATWLYSGRLDDPITLPDGGLFGATYWMEVSGFGEADCAVHATHSRDHGNNHYAPSTWPEGLEPDPHPYSVTQIGSVDLGLCEISGLGTPPDVLGVCCTCSAVGPGICQENFTQKECVEILRGVWVPCADCSQENVCPGRPANDDCDSPYLISNLPVFDPEQEDPDELIIPAQSNICAFDDGPGLQGGNGGCAGSIGGDANLHDDMWYAYTAEACGELTVHSCNDTDTMDQMIAIYDKTGIECPLLTSDEIGCGDDTCGPGAGPATVTVAVIEDNEYLIRCGGWNVEVPGGFFGSPRGVFTLHISLRRNCPSVIPPTLALPPHDIKKNRYISIDPTANGVNDVSLGVRITMTSSLIDGVEGVGIDNYAAQPDANCISLVTRNDPGVINWGGCPTVHLTGCPIVPTSTFAIVVIDTQGTVSDPLSADTQAKPVDKWHGDVVGFFDDPNWTGPNNVVNADDFLSAIKTFQDINADNATHLSVTDVAPNLNGEQINLIVNINDVFAIIQGFQGFEYLGNDLTRCQ